MFEFICSILQTDNITNILGMIGLALLTVLVPIGIAAAGIKRNGFEFLDEKIFFDHIIKPSSFLRDLSLIYVPLLLWNADFPQFQFIFQLILFVAWCFGIYGIIKFLKELYDWVKSDGFDLRYEYLKNLTDPEKIKESWWFIWKVKDMEFQYEKELLDIFFETIDKRSETNDAETIGELSEGDNADTIVILLNNFNNSINNRSTWFFYNSKIFQKILELLFLTWKRRHQSLEKLRSLPFTHSSKRGGEREDLSNALQDYESSCNILFLVLKKIIKKFLDERLGLFSSQIDDHIKKYREEIIKTKKYGEIPQEKYINTVISACFQALTEKNKESPDNDIILDFFPRNWKIETENDLGEEYSLSHALPEAFLSWAKEKILNPVNAGVPDKSLDRITNNLFPFVEPRLWAELLTFSAGERNVESLINQKINFGFMPKDIFFKDVPQGPETERISKRNAIELATPLFPEIFSKENLERFIHDLEKMESEYKDGSIEEGRRKEFISIFKEMKQILDE